MDDDVLEHMTFALGAFENDARALGLTLLARLLSMACLEIALARENVPELARKPKSNGHTIDAARNPLVVGSWNWDVKRDRFVADPEVAKIFNISPSVAAAGVPQSIFADAIHPLDRRRVDQAIAKSLQMGEPFHIVYRLKLMDGSMRKVFAVGRVVFENGEASRFPGTIIDLTDDRPTGSPQSIN